MKLKEKSEIIRDLVKVTNTSGEKHFDKLYDKTTEHLTKLLKVCNLLVK